MPYDPLYFETEGPPALLVELGVPAGLDVRIGRKLPESWRVNDRRLDPYQVMLLVTEGPAAAHEGLPTWTPGADAIHIWLIRIRYGHDRAYGEIRPSVAEGLLCQVRWPFVWEGQGPVIDGGQRDRANYGLELLCDLAPKPGRPPDALVYPDEAPQFKEQVIQASMGRLRAGYPLRDITQPLVAPAMGLSPRTLQRRLSGYHLNWAALKREAYRRYQASRGEPVLLSTALIERLTTEASQRSIPVPQLVEDLLQHALHDRNPGMTLP
jgi:hypothetical protein